MLSPCFTFCSFLICYPFSVTVGWYILFLPTQTNMPVVCLVILPIGGILMLMSFLGNAFLLSVLTHFTYPMFHSCLFFCRFLVYFPLTKNMCLYVLLIILTNNTKMIVNCITAAPLWCILMLMSFLGNAFLLPVLTHLTFSMFHSHLFFCRFLVYFPLTKAVGWYVFLLFASRAYMPVVCGITAPSNIPTMAVGSFLHRYFHINIIDDCIILSILRCENRLKNMFPLFPNIQCRIYPFKSFGQSNLG